MDQDALLTIIQFNNYANRIVLDAAGELPENVVMRTPVRSHGTVFELLRHMLGGERAFLNFGMGRAFDFDEILALATLADLRAYWLALGEEAVAFVQGQDATGLGRAATFSFGTTSWHLPVWQLLVQAAVHTQFHRGELAILLGELGHELPTIDMMFYLLEQSGQTPPGAEA
jgi:uncharacterized damage-inducible protein DinB